MDAQANEELLNAIKKLDESIDATVKELQNIQKQVNDSSDLAKVQFLMTFVWPGLQQREQALLQTKLALLDKIENRSTPATEFSKIINRIALAAQGSKGIMPPSPTKTFFPLKERDDQIKLFSDTFVHTFKSFTSRSVLKKDWCLCSITGASGLGKTRLAIETIPFVKQHIADNIEEYKDKNPEIIDSLLASLSTAVTCTTDMVHDSLLALLERDVETFVSLTLLQSTLFPSEHISNLARVLNPSDRLSLKEVIQSIKEIKAIKGEPLPEHVPLTMVLHIDEYQRLVSEQDKSSIEKDSSTRRTLKLRQIAIGIMTLVMTSPVFIVPIFTGTLPMQYLKIFPTTDYRHLCLQVHTLSVDAAVEILHNRNANWSSNVSDPAFKRLLKALGVVPRALQYLVEEMESNGIHNRAHNDAHTVNEELYDAVQEEFKSVYKADSWSRALFTRLLQHVVDGTKVTHDTELIPGVKVAALAADGYIFELPTAAGAKENTVFALDMPYIYLTAANTVYRIFPQEFLKWGKVFDTHTSETFPLFFEMFRHNLLSSLGKETATLGELYLNAYIDSKLKGVTVVLQPMSLYYAASQDFPKDVDATGDLKVMNNAVLNLFSRSAAVWVGRNNPTTDGFSIRPMDQGGHVLVLTQVTSTIPSADYVTKPAERKRTFVDEKCVALSNVEEATVFKESLKVFCYVNNHQQSLKYITSTQQSQSIVICKENWTKYFSPIFACFL